MSYSLIGLFIMVMAIYTMIKVENICRECNKEQIWTSTLESKLAYIDHAALVSGVVGIVIVLLGGIYG